MRLTRCALLVLLASGCAADGDAAFNGRYDRQQLQHALADPEGEAGLLLGDFTMQNKGVVDGDTIKVEGLDASMRLLGLDCEETFKNEKALRAYEIGFEEYLRNEQVKTAHPVKIPTPMGMEAKHFAEDFFRDTHRVRLERDQPKDIRDRYNRYLAYVFVQKDGKWVNYNVECVRAGMSPYFTKYGRSTRFHEEFAIAQEEARAAKRGVWDPSKEHYRDYPLRLAWWDLRGDFVAEFQREASKHENYITLTHWDSLARLEHFEGDEVVLLGNVGDVRPGRGGAPTRVMLARRMFDDFTLVFFDDEVLDRSKIEHAKGEFVRVRGTVTRYRFKNKRGRRTGEEQLQIVVKDARQIEFVDTWALAKGRVPLAPGPDDPTEPEPEPEPEPGDEPGDEPSDTEAPSDSAGDGATNPPARPTEPIDPPTAQPPAG